MKKTIFTFALLLCTSVYSIGQETMRYIPMEFDGIQPKWVHVFRDLSKYPSDTLNLKNYVFDYKDYTMTGNQIFTLQNSLDVNNPFGGLFIDNVDLTTGKTRSTFAYDYRKEASKMHLIPLGIIPNDDRTIDCIASRYYLGSRKGWLEYFKLDDQDLSILEHRYHSNQDDSASISVGVDNLRFDKFIRASDSTLYYFNSSGAVDRNKGQGYSYIHSQIVTKAGISTWDTLVLVDSSKLNLPLAPNSYPLQLFQRGKALLGYLTFYYYNSDSIVSTIKYYDHRLNLIEAHDIHWAFDDDAIFSYIDHVDENYIYVVCKKLDGFLTKYWTYLIFDFNGNLIERIPLKGNFGRMFFQDVKVIHLPKEKRTIVFYNDRQKEKFFVLQTAGIGKFTEINAFETRPKDMSFRPTTIVHLKNGDFLMHGRQIQFLLDSTSNQKRVYPHASLMIRWDKSIIKPLTTINPANTYNSFTLYSNPVNSHVKIAFRHPFTGTIQLSDMNGHVVKIWNLHQASEYRADLSNVAKGTYLITPIGHMPIHSSFPTKKLIVD